MPLRKKVLTPLLIDQVFPSVGLEGGVWFQDSQIVFLRNWLMLGLDFQRSQRMEAFTINVFARPLYMAGADSGIFGIVARIGALTGKGDTWWDVSRDQTEIKRVETLRQDLKESVVPLFERLRTEEDFLKATYHKLSGPFLTLETLLVTGSPAHHLALGYMAAWCGKPLVADMLLKKGLNRHADAQELDHVMTTRSLLRKPDQLRAFLEQSARETLTRCGLDRAPSLSSLIAKRKTAVPRNQHER